MNPNDTVFVTGNPFKAQQLSNYLGIPLEHQKIDLPEIQSLSLHEIVQAKAQSAFEVVGKPVLVEDVSVVFHAMKTLPGPFIKWFMTELGSQGLCYMLDGYSDRSATCSVLFGLYDGQTLHTFESSLQGQFLHKPGKEDGFGYNSIFQPEGFDKPLSELDPEVVSLRKEAFQQLRDFFRR